MTSLDIVNVANIFNNIICSGIGCLFLFRLSQTLSNHKHLAARYFFWFFLTFGCAFATMAMRNWVPIIYSIAINNALYITAAYMLLLGTLFWYRLPGKKFWQQLAIFHISFVTFGQLSLYLFVPDSLAERIFFGGANNALIYATMFIWAFRHRHRSENGAPLLMLSSFVCIIAASVPSAMIIFDGNPYVYQGAMLITQNLACYFLLGSLLSLFLFDQIRMHYKRSIVDELTGLYNRRYFKDELKKRTVESPTTGIIAIADIDLFKKINDRYGHDVGDMVIRRVAYQLKTQLSHQGLVARYGGEEFIFYLPLTLDHAHQALLDLKSHIEDFTIRLDSDEQITTTISIGFCPYHSSQHSLEDAVRAADIALYDAKKRGRNLVSYQHLDTNQLFASSTH